MPDVAGYATAVLPKPHAKPRCPHAKPRCLNMTARASGLAALNQ